MIATAPSGRFLEVSVGAFNACGVRDDATVVCWPEITVGTLQPQDLKVLLD
jgi:hypothetical protein